MTGHPFILRDVATALPRFALLLCVLFAPFVAMQSVQAGSDAVIEDSRKLSSGAGIVLLVGLQRG